MDLAAYANQSVNLRFRFGSDMGTGQEGWYVDDVLITALGNFVLSTPDSLVVSVNGDDLILNWADDDNPNYRILSDTDSEGAFSTIEGETTNNTFTIVNGWQGADLKFYRVVGWDGQN